MMHELPLSNGDTHFCKVTVEQPVAVHESGEVMTVTHKILDGVYTRMPNRGARYHLFCDDRGRDIYLTQDQFNAVRRGERIILPRSQWY